MNVARQLENINALDLPSQVLTEGPAIMRYGADSKPESRPVK